MTTDAGKGIAQRLSLVTLGVSDVPRARDFYERLGFKASRFDSDDVTFFEMSNGVVLALFGRAALAEDAGVPHGGTDFRAVTCAINLDSEADVDAALEHARHCGGEVTRPARKVFWGGYSGYFADPDGHLWEVAYNPIFPVDAEGRLQLPDAQAKDTT